MEIFDFLKYLHNECIRLSEPISFDKKQTRHIYLVCLYGTLIELAGSLIVLIESKRKRGVPIIFRSFEKAGMQDEYHSLYNILSNDTHSNIRALINHNLEIHEIDFRVIYYKDAVSYTHLRAHETR